MNALLVSGANPVYSTADAKAFQKAMEKIPYVVSFSSYMDETAMQADLILPNHNYLERYGDVPNIELECHECMMVMEAEVEEDTSSEDG